MDKTLFLDVINTVTERKTHTLRFTGECLECVSYEGFMFTSTLWKEGVKSGLKPISVEETHREGGDIIIKGFIPTPNETKTIRDYLTSRGPLEVSISYHCVTPSRTTPQPLSHWNDLNEKHLPENTLSQRTQILEYVADEVYTTSEGYGSVLDVGCGDGKLLSLLAEKNLRMDLWGVDLNKTCVKNAKNNLGRKANILYGDARRLPHFLPKKDFDVVCAVGLLDTQVTTRKESEQITSGIHDTLKEEGLLVTANYTIPTLTPKDIQKKGFTILKKTVPTNFFTAKEPKELYVAKKTTLI